MISFPNAKINIGLSVTEKRSDGFHNLETVFYPVGWNDILEIVDSETLAFSSSGINLNIDSENNLVKKAYNLLSNDFNLSPVKIHLHKSIPFGAGLGGGSSDAAFMLKMLNDQNNLGLSTSDLQRYALQLGSDCAFFINNLPVFASGRGEIFTKIDIRLNDLFIIIVKPEVTVNTASAFKLIVPQKPEKSLIDLIKLPINTWKYHISNQFEIPVIEQFPVIGTIKNQLYDLGAIYASMSGSGSSIFGIFEAEPSNWKDTFNPHYLTFGQQL